MSHTTFTMSFAITRATEEVFQLLEDNQVTLSTMKASRYVKAFEKEVDRWERTLSHILEVVEMILQVQRQWMYLEVCLAYTPFSHVAYTPDTHILCFFHSEYLHW